MMPSPKVAIATGAGSGFGHAVARVLLERAIASSRPAGGEVIVTTAGNGVGALVVPSDVNVRRW